jgi:hypothetical protein
MQLYANQILSTSLRVNGDYELIHVVDRVPRTH